MELSFTYTSGHCLAHWFDLDSWGVVILNKLHSFLLLHFTVEHQKPDQDMYALVPASRA